MLVFEIGENYEITKCKIQAQKAFICEICAYKIQLYDIIFFIEQI